MCGQIIVYWVCAELWKLARRIRLKKKGYKIGDESGTAEDGLIDEKKGMPDKRLHLEDTIPPPL